MQAPPHVNASVHSHRTRVIRGHAYNIEQRPASDKSDMRWWMNLSVHFLTCATRLWFVSTITVIYEPVSRRSHLCVLSPCGEDSKFEDSSFIVTWQIRNVWLYQHFSSLALLCLTSKTFRSDSQSSLNINRYSIFYVTRP